MLWKSQCVHVMWFIIIHNKGVHPKKIHNKGNENSIILTNFGSIVFVDFQIEFSDLANNSLRNNMG